MLRDECWVIVSPILLNSGEYSNGTGYVCQNLEDIAILKQLGGKLVSDDRRGLCHYDMFDEQVNNLLRDLIVSGRTEHITITLDNDKIWHESTGESSKDKSKIG